MLQSILILEGYLTLLLSCFQFASSVENEAFDAKNNYYLDVISNMLINAQGYRQIFNYY